MKKPELRITKSLGDIPVEGVCSACSEEGPFQVASTKPSKESNQKALDAAFNRHFNKVHKREDASQAAARIVREATE